MPSGYEDVQDGKWYRIDQQIYLACCDCHLVHHIEFRMADGAIEWRLIRDNRRTALLRRGLKKDKT